MVTRPLVLTAAIVALLAGAWSAARPDANGPPPCREAAIVSLRTGKVLRRLSARDGASGPGYATGALLPGEIPAADGAGGWYVAGLGLGHVRRDGSLDRAWHPSLRRRLFALERVGSHLYATDGRRVYALDARTGRRLWVTDVVSGAGLHRILSLHADRFAVYIGGNFTRVGSVQRVDLAALDAQTGRLLDWQAPAPFDGNRNAVGVVGAVALSASRLYFSGTFDLLGGAGRIGGVAAVSVRDGRATSFSPRSRLYAPAGIAVSGRLVLLGGREGGGVFDAESGKRLRRFQTVLAAEAITVHGSTAYLGGNVRTDIGAHNLLAIDLVTGKRRPWFPNIARFVSVGTIAVSGDRAFVGGQFCSTLG